MLKYSKEILEAAVRDSISVAGVLRKLGLAQAGGTHAYLSRRIKEFGIDTSHFLGQGANRGPNHRGPRRLRWEEVLVLRTEGRRQKPHVLRRALIESGREYKCEGNGCAIRGEWLGKPIILHVNHRNGNWLDDRPENVEFNCPNCHSQSAKYCGAKGFAELTSRARWYQNYRKKKKGPVAELADASGLGPAAL
jgi:hypothetical protein